MLEVIGWIGGAAFALCGAPQAWHCWKNKTAAGVSWGFLGLWFLGEICSLIYVYPTGKLPLIVNYMLNIVFTGLILRYKFKDMENNTSKQSIKMHSCIQ